MPPLPVVKEILAVPGPMDVTVPLLLTFRAEVSEEVKVNVEGWRMA